MNLLENFCFFFLIMQLQNLNLKSERKETFFEKDIETEVASSEQNDTEE